MIKVGIIGCGSITKLRHAPEYSQNSEAEIAGFFDPRTDRAREMADRFGGKVYSSVEEMLEDYTIDAVSVCAANAYHAPITIQALKAGKHVLCEKPMAMSVDECREMIKAADASGKVLMIGHNQRFVPAHIKAREIIQSGEIGNVISFRTTFGHGGPEMWSADKSSNTWFFKKDIANLGVIADLGVHKIDLIRWLTGEEITEVSAFMCTLDKKDQTGKAIDVDDNAICLLRLKSGAIGTMTASWTNYGEEDNSTVVYCTKGVVKICSDKEYPVIVEKINGDKVFYKVGNIQTNDNQTKSGVIDAFIDSVISGKEPAVSGEDGLKAMQVVFACVESAEKGETVRII